MNKCERAPMAPPPLLRGQDNPSFSSSLLDAIYRSIDESDGRLPDLDLPSATKKQSNLKDKHWRRPTPTPAYLCRPRDEDRGHRCLFSTSSSSECSSFGGFSSSDADSINRPHPVLTRRNRIRSDPAPERKRTISIRSRLRDLRSLGTPASPGTRFSAFINAIFAGGAGNRKKPKFAGGEEESAISSARSRVSKAPTSSRGGNQRLPVAAQGCGEKWSRGGGPVAAKDPRMMVDELLRRFGVEDAEEDSDCESVSSSDLFELDSLSAIGRFKDELPVYETTNLNSNRAIAHRFIV